MPALGGCSIVSSLPLTIAFVMELVVALCLFLLCSSISSLSTVALEGSPGSSMAASGAEAPFASRGLVALDRVRARLLGGTVLSTELLGACLRLRVL